MSRTDDGRMLRQFDRQCFEHLVRYTARIPGAEGMVTFANLSPRREVRQIIEQVDYFSSIAQNFEWKIYEFDRPDRLQALLAAESFVADEPEVFMALPLGQPTRQQTFRHRDWEVRRVTNDAGVRNVVTDCIRISSTSDSKKPSNAATTFCVSTRHR